MWTAWLVVALGAVLVMGPAFAIVRSATLGTRNARFASILVVYSALILSFGWLWLPPLGAVAEVERSTRTLLGSSGSLSCRDSSQAVSMLERASNGLLKMEEDDSLRIPGAAWRDMPETQRSDLLNILRTHRSCRGSAAAVVVRDADSNAILFSAP
jgi:hypothetical protein